MIGLREDRQMRARMVDMLNHTVAACRRERAVASKLACAGGAKRSQKAGVCCADSGSKLPRHSRSGFTGAGGGF